MAGKECNRLLLNLGWRTALAALERLKVLVLVMRQSIHLQKHLRVNRWQLVAHDLLITVKAL
jgi:hypothetical protein